MIVYICVFLWTLDQGKNGFILNGNKSFSQKKSMFYFYKIFINNFEIHLESLKY